MFYCHSCYFLINFDLLNTHLDFWYNVIVNLVNVKMCKFSTIFFTLKGGIYFFLGTLLGQFLISGLMLATDEGFRIFKLFSFETRTIKRPVCFLRTHHYWEISTTVVLKPDSLNWKHLKTEIHNESCHGSIHPNTEFFSQGILSISLLAGLLSGSVEAGCDERRFNPLILIFNWAEDTKTNSVLPVQPGPGGGAWTSALATPAQLSGGNHQTPGVSPVTWCWPLIGHRGQYWPLIGRWGDTSPRESLIPDERR